MNVLIFGASGATGRELLRQGRAVKALLRHRTALAAYRDVQLVHGNVEVRASVENAMAGQQAVICILGSRTLLRRELAIAVGVHNILPVMELSGIRRLIYLSSDSVGASLQRSNRIRRLLLSVILRNPTADHELNERMIQKSPLDWTLVGAPSLNNGKPTRKYQSGST